MNIEINNNIVNIYITKKISNKNTYFRIKEDLNLYVTTNKFTSDKDILRMINDNIGPITNMYNKQVSKNEMNNSFMYLGNIYDVVYTNSNSIDFGTNRVFIGKSVDVDKFFLKQAKIIFLDHLNYWYNNFDRKIPYPRLRIRKMTTRWGVCNFKDNIVTLNLELIKKDLSCLDYVIVHELSHFIEHNHSSNFWKVVEDNYPNYKKVRKQMKNY